MTTKEMFMKIKSLQEIKTKNETAVPIEVLQSKYKVPYEKLCNELKDMQKELRLRYIECIRIFNEFASNTVYMDFNNDDGWEQLINDSHKIFEETEQDPVIRCLLIGFCNALDEMNKIS